MLAEGGRLMFVVNEMGGSGKYLRVEVEDPCSGVRNPAVSWLIGRGSVFVAGVIIVVVLRHAVKGCDRVSLYVRTRDEVQDAGTAPSF